MFCRVYVAAVTELYDDLPLVLEPYLNILTAVAKLLRDIINIEDFDNLQQDLDRLQHWSETWVMKFILPNAEL